MFRGLSVGLVALAACAAAHGQNQSLTWSEDVEKGVAESKRTLKPMMCYVLGREADRDDDIEREQKKAFRDPRVIELSRRFVTVKLSRSRHREQLQKWGLPGDAHLYIVFVTPDGERYGDVGPQAAGIADTLAQKMVLAFREYRQKLFEKELKSRLESEKTEPKDIRIALKVIEEFIIEQADATIVELLQRPKLAEDVRKQALLTLAELSTRVAVKELVDEGVRDEAAAAALRKCTPQAAEYMLEGLDAVSTRVLVYDAVTKICKIQNVKPEKFWQGDNERIKSEEIARVKDLVRKTAKRWSEKYAEYR